MGSRDLNMSSDLGVETFSSGAVRRRIKNITPYSQVVEIIFGKRLGKGVFQSASNSLDQ
jgi:hypothetical protein